MMDVKRFSGGAGPGDATRSAGNEKVEAVKRSRYSFPKQLGQVLQHGY